jgi:endonuclease YncB( thermonuclease family)
LSKELKEQTIHVRIAGVDAPEVRWLYKDHTLVAKPSHML